MSTFITTPEGRRIAYSRLSGQGPSVVFLGGFNSDMTGTKAVALEGWARETGRAFLRFDYSGHGQSSGRFEDGALSDWLADARRVIAAQTEGPQVLVGSSMGGWLSLLLARKPDLRIAGLVTIAAAPDFTVAMRQEMDDATHAALMRDGRILRPSDYGDPYVITRRLIEDGMRHLVMTAPLSLGIPVRMLQGTADRDVPVAVATGLLDHADGPDIRLTLVKGADHRFSTPACLALVTQAVEDVLARVAGRG